MRSPSSASRRGQVERILEGWARPSFTFAELAARYRAAYRSDPGTHDDLTSAFGALIHDRLVVRLGTEPGRTRHVTRYLFVGGAPDREPLDDLPARIIELLEAHYAAEQSPMSTADVREALRRRGDWPDRFARLHTVLRTMSESASHVRPPIRRASGLSLGGIPAAFWLPGWAPDQCALIPANGSEALRRAIAAASASLDRPISKREISSWLATQPPFSPIRHVVAPGRVSSLLHNLRDQKAVATTRVMRLRVVKGPLTCHGGPPERYALRDLGDDDVALCRLLDAVRVLRPAEELTGIARLERHRADRLARHELAQARRAVLRRALTAYVGELDTSEVRTLAARARSGVRAETLWVGERRGSCALRRRQLRPLEQTMADLDAVERLLNRDDERRETREELAFVGICCLLAFGELRDFVLRQTTSGVLIPSNRPQLLYRNARRFPNPGGEGRRTPERLSRIDRVDALSDVFSHAADPVVRAVVARAHALVGHVLRDARPLIRLLDRLPASDEAVKPARMAIALFSGVWPRPVAEVAMDDGDPTTHASVAWLHQ